MAPGSDDIASYDIYESDDGGPYTAFLTATNLTSATFTGQPGHTYSFFSVATNSLGLVQPTPSGAQATTTVASTPTPTPTPTQISGQPTPTQSRKGITTISVGFNQPANPASATNPGLYHAFRGVKKKGKTVYTKPLKIGTISYNSQTNSVTIKLARPYKGKLELAVDGAIEALDGSISDVDFSTLIK
jgi:hypothetical protein